MTASTLHIVFNPSGAAGLREALRQAGRDDRVAGFMDDLSFGPIAPPDAETRCRWVEHELGYEWEDVCAKSASFWEEALSPGDCKVAWLSRRSTLEYTGFLEWLWRLGDQPFGLVDLSDATVVGRAIDGSPVSRRAFSVGLLHPHEIVDSGLPDSAQEVTPDARRRYRDLWARLRAENAALRVLGPDGLVSAPITHFDALLLSHARAQWQKAAMVIARALTDFSDASLRQTDDLVLAARLRALAEAGHLESEGDLSNIRHSEVRLPVGGPSSC
jgi:uncharacterized protein DUF3658/uncharacterized protein DUF1835